MTIREKTSWKIKYHKSYICYMKMIFTKIKMWWRNYTKMIFTMQICGGSRSYS